MDDACFFYLEHGEQRVEKLQKRIMLHMCLSVVHRVLFLHREEIRWQVCLSFFHDDEWMSTHGFGLVGCWVSCFLRMHGGVQIAFREGDVCASLAIRSIYMVYQRIGLGKVVLWIECSYCFAGRVSHLAW